MQRAGNAEYVFLGDAAAVQPLSVEQVEFVLADRDRLITVSRLMGAEAPLQHLDHAVHLSIDPLGAFGWLVLRLDCQF